ncbi:MAG: hypothetical protein V4700_00625 [Pseudomonadota bacterium]
MLKHVKTIQHSSTKCNAAIIKDPKLIVKLQNSGYDPKKVYQAGISPHIYKVRSLENHKRKFDQLIKPMTSKKIVEEIAVKALRN